MVTIIPDLPVEGQDPWYDDRNEFDQAVRTRLNEEMPNLVSPASYGATGDGVANDTAALQLAINAGATFGFAVDLRGLTYRTLDELTLPAETVLVNGTIHCTAATKRILRPTGDNVRISNVKIKGRHAVATASVNEFAVAAEGASAAAPIRNLTLDNVDISHVGMYGAYLKHVDGFSISGGTMTDLGYAAVAGLSALNGEITENVIDNVLAGFSGNGYGITLSREETDSLVTQPRSANILIAQNRVSRVPWEGIDTHGGENLLIVGNEILQCEVAIAMVGSDDSLNDTKWAPRNVNIVGNIIDAVVTDGSLGNGISIAGAPGADTTSSLEAATGQIVGNVIRGMGDQSATGSGAIRLRDTVGFIVTDNLIIEPSPNGIVLQNTNFGVVVLGNTIIDNWSDVQSAAAAIHLPGGYNTGNISNNMHLDNGGHAGATYRNARGYNCPSTLGVEVQANGNVFKGSVLPINGTTATKNKPEFQTLFGGNAAAPGLAFGSDTASGWYPVAASDLALSIAGARKLRFQAATMFFEDGYNIAFGTGSGTRIGTVSTTHKLAFWGATPIVRPTGTPAAATDAATTQALVNDIRTKLIALGLIS